MKCCYERLLPNREFLHWPNTRYCELQWRKTGYFLMNGATQENRKLMLKSPNSSIQGLRQIFKGIPETGICKHCPANFNWRTLSLAIYGKGHQPWNLCFCKGSDVQLPVVSSAFCSVCIWWEGDWFWVQLEFKLFSSAVLAEWLVVLFCCLWKATKYFFKQDKNILSWFHSYKVIKVLANIWVVMNFQYINLSNQHTVHL